MAPTDQDSSYTNFCSIVSGYRMFRVIEQAVQTGIIDLLDGTALPADELVSSAGLRQAEGGRFIAYLVAGGIVLQQDGKITLSEFARSYLARSGSHCQRGVLEFEQILMENWSRLSVVLKEGQGALVSEKSPEESTRRLHLFQQAMGEAAEVRAAELWDAVSGLQEAGTIVDVGAGNGVYLKRFLQQHPAWNAVGCDLADVCQKAQGLNDSPSLSFYPCNILDAYEMSVLADRFQAGVDLILVSNLCHCYSDKENLQILRQFRRMLKPDGVMIVHDFFRDTSDAAAMYDLHMMVNTWNGRCYSTSEFNMLQPHVGIKLSSMYQLPSGSTALIYTPR